MDSNFEALAYPENQAEFFVQLRQGVRVTMKLRRHLDELPSKKIDVLSLKRAALNQFNLLDRGVLKLPSLDLPSTLTIMLFLLTYVLVLGPLNYVVLRRTRLALWNQWAKEGYGFADEI